MKLKFREFEKINNLLEKYTIDEIRDNSSILTEAELDISIMSDVEKINEGLLGDLWNKALNAISKHIPGGTLKKVEELLKKYKDEMEESLDAELKLRKDVLGENNDDKERRDNFNKQMKRVNDKLEEFKDNSENEFAKMTKGQPDRIRDYISMRVAQIKAEVSKTELDQAMSNAKLYTKKEQEKIKTDESEAVKAAGELTKKTTEDAKKNEDYMKKLKKDNDVSLKDVYKRKSKEGEEQEVEVIGADAENQQVMVKNLKTEKTYSLNVDDLGTKKGKDKSENDDVEMDEHDKIYMIKLEDKDGIALKDVYKIKDHAGKEQEVEVIGANAIKLRVMVKNIKSGNIHPMEPKDLEEKNKIKKDKKKEEEDKNIDKKIPQEAVDFKADDEYTYTNKEGNKSKVKIVKDHDKYIQKEAEEGHVWVQGKSIFQAIIRGNKIEGGRIGLSREK